MTWGFLPVSSINSLLFTAWAEATYWSWLNNGHLVTLVPTQHCFPTTVQHSAGHSTNDILKIHTLIKCSLQIVGIILDFSDFFPNQSEKHNDSGIKTQASKCQLVSFFYNVLWLGANVGQLVTIYQGWYDHRPKERRFKNRFCQNYPKW